MSFKKDKPYSILILAAPFIAGCIILLLRTGPSVVDSPPGPYLGDRVVEMASVNMTYAAGVIGLVIGGLIIWVYFKVKND